MSQIVSIHIGTFGSNVAHQFWKQIAQQQIVNQNKQLKQNFEGKNLFFQEINHEKKIKYKARNIFIDMNSRDTQNILKINPYDLYNEKNIIQFHNQSKGIFSQAKYSTKSDIKNSIEQSCRYQIQKCDRLSGFILTNAIDGGCGSGLYQLTLKYLKEQYAYGEIIQSYSLYPNLNLSMSPLNVYNTIFSISSTIYQADFQTMYDNVSATKLLRKEGKIDTNFNDLNKVFARGMIDQTSSYRFSGQSNSSQRKVATNMVMFPRMKFFYQCLSQFNTSVKQSLINSSLKNQSFLFGQQYPLFNKYFCINAHLRDPLAYQQQMSKQIQSILQEKRISKTEWILSNFYLSNCEIINSKRGKSASLLYHSASQISYFKQLIQKFKILFRRKAFFHHYTNCGMDQLELIEAQDNVLYIINEYQDYQNMNPQIQEDTGQEGWNYQL